jgi:hypothetical protein
MKKFFWPSIGLMFTAIFLLNGPCFAEVKVSADKVKAGDVVTFEGTIAPGQELYIAVAQQTMFKATLNAEKE